MSQYAAAGDVLFTAYKYLGQVASSLMVYVSVDTEAVGINSGKIDPRYSMTIGKGMHSSCYRNELLKYKLYFTRTFNILLFLYKSVAVRQSVRSTTCTFRYKDFVESQNIRFRLWYLSRYSLKR